MKALAMMVEKESGSLENTEFTPLWEPKTLLNGQKRSEAVDFTIYLQGVGSC
jgi:hypothetical protein